MREIEFRGKRVDNGKWAYGYYTKGYRCAERTLEDMIYSFDNNEFEYYIIKSNTLGQYTGLKDKNGTKIFDGDIVKGEYWISVVRYGRIGYDSGAGLTGFSLQEVCCDWKSPIKVTLREMETDFDTKEKFYNCERCLDLSEIEVVGNVYDNKLEEFYE